MAAVFFTASCSVYNGRFREKDYDDSTMMAASHSAISRTPARRHTRAPLGSATTKFFFRHQTKSKATNLYPIRIHTRRQTHTHTTHTNTTTTALNTGETHTHTLGTLGWLLLFHLLRRHSKHSLTCVEIDDRSISSLAVGIIK